MTTFEVKLLKIHQVLGQDIMRFVCGMRGKANQYLVKVRLRLVEFPWQELMRGLLMGLLKGIKLSQVCLDGFLVKLKLDDDILLVGDIGLRGISPLVCEVGHVSHLGDIVINDEVLEAERDVACCNPDTSRSTSLRLNELFLLLFINRWLLFVLLFLISGMNIEGEASGAAPFLLRRG
jgi:hypothetical protein